MAEFARLQSVSRKTAYEWKAKGYLVFLGGAVDVERSNSRLAAAGLSRLKPVTLRRQASRQVRQGDAGAVTSGEALLRHAHQFPKMLTVSVFAAGVWDLVLELLAHLPMETVRPIVERVVAMNRRAAVEIALIDGEGPPEGFASWADHPWLTRPALTEAEWQELEEEHWARGAGGGAVIAYPLIRHITGENPTRRVVWTVTAPGPRRTETFAPEVDGGVAAGWRAAAARLRTEAEAKHWVAIFDEEECPPRL
ncbi:hypothetical protein EJV46_16130 [Roseococcus sp. SYP-B2431]|uniref:hypothetical protein n=1 Tax=Roseococcus sp. SYP-B2431 TaxID=2496640 RepID=UPI00103DCA1A|nr:hypothetical protein [Roseococcus sp. SYP-B2431]TCH97644.1 hypothetical protein EJV46_16130 [Roseococcus sp. SYP-B2431]